MSLYDDAGQAGKEAMDGALKSFSAVTKGFQQIAAETGDYTKRSYEQSAQLVEKLSQVRTLDKAFELQSDFTRTSYEAWVSQATRVGEIFSEMARESYRPFEAAFSGLGKNTPFKAS